MTAIAEIAIAVPRCRMTEDGGVHIHKAIEGQGGPTLSGYELRLCPACGVVFFQVENGGVGAIKTSMPIGYG